MKHTINLITYLCTLLVLLSCSNKPALSPTPTEDVEALEIQISRIAAQDPHRAYSIIDSVYQSQKIAPYQADFLRAIVYSQDDAKMDSAHMILEGLLEHDSIIADNRMQANILALLIKYYRYRNNNERVLHWATRLSDLNRNIGDKVQMLSIQVEIGFTLTQLGQTEEGLAKIDEAITQLDPIKKFTEFNACLVAIRRKIHVMNELGNYQEIISLAERMAIKVNEYKDAHEQYDDGTNHQPATPEDLEIYCDNNLAQAYAFLADGYASIGTQTEDLVRVKNMQMARKYAILFSTLKFGQSLTGRKLICSAWFKMGDFKQMEAAYAELKEKWCCDTLHATYATMLYHLAHSNYRNGNYDESFNYWERHNTLSKLLNNKNLKKEALEHAARYHEQEQQLMLQKAENELARKNIILYVALLIIAVGIFISTYFNMVRRRIITKNRALVKLINELQDTKAETKEQPKEYIRDDSLFYSIDAYIRSKRLYADPNLQRQDVLDHFSINKNTLNALFNEHNGGLSFPAYINNIRLEEGQHLLRSQPRMTISEIADSIGFTAPNFREQFKKKYGITPTEFRQSL